MHYDQVNNEWKWFVDTRAPRKSILYLLLLDLGRYRCTDDPNVTINNLFQNMSDTQLISRGTMRNPEVYPLESIHMCPSRESLD